MVAVSFSGPASTAVVPSVLARPLRDNCSVTGGAVMEDNHVVVATIDEDPGESSSLVLVN